MNNRKRNYISILLVLFFIVPILTFPSCAPKTFNRSEKLLYTTNQVLQSAKKFRILALESAADYYKQGLLSEAKKDKIIKLGDELQKSINKAADALIAYAKSGNDDSSKVTKYINIFNTVFGKFTNLTIPIMTDNHDV